MIQLFRVIDMKYNSFLYAPAVFVVGDEYQIFIRLKKKAMVWVEIDGVRYYDHSNGILRSFHPVHKVTVPQKALDEAKSYTVGVRTLKKRLPYFSKVFPDVFESFVFHPVPTEGEIGICHFADVHGDDAQAYDAFKKCDKPAHLLVLNGDVIDNSGDVKYFDTIYNICDFVTHGNIPVIFSRGNHDLRGIAAEKLEEYVPTNRGKTFFTAKVGNIWSLVLDCGEDKPDKNEEYGGTVCCEAFRKEETEFIKETLKKKAFEGEGIKHKLVFTHSPFTWMNEPPFDIEKVTFKEWAKLVGEKVKPELMICGHLHRCGEFPVGGELDNRSIQFCPILLGSYKNGKRGDNKFGMAYITLNDEGYNLEMFYNK